MLDGSGTAEVGVIVAMPTLLERAVDLRGSEILNR